MKAKNADYPIEEIPLDGSMRMMEKTEYIAFEDGRKHSIERTVYRHKPTGNLFYKFNGQWFGTYPEYCYNTLTHEKGELCTIHCW